MSTGLAGREVPITGGRVRSRDGTRISYLSVGEGPVLVCLHGGLTSGVDWLPVARLLSHRFRFVIVDRRGHGVSDRGASGHSVALEVEDLAAVLATTDGARAVLAHSFGALIALYAAVTPLAAAVGALVLYEPPLLIDPARARAHAADSAALVDRGEYESALLSALRDMLEVTEAELDAMRSAPRSWAGLVAMAPALRWQAEMTAEVAGVVEPFRGIALPTLLLLGGRSRPDPFGATVDALVGVIPRADRVVLAGQGHAAMLRGPQLLADEVARFLDRDR
jgi:pimeloyl-ACP methyl ester carboxylesterase